MSKTALPPFKVGQVIYLIPSGERRVMPAQVTEEILRRTISGEETVWMIQLAGSQKSVPLDPEAAEYYVNISDLRKTLIDRTTQQVNTMVDRVVSAAAEAFPQHEEESNVMPMINTQIDQSATVLMPDGTRAKVKIP
jgi:hypothetical protein